MIDKNNNIHKGRYNGEKFVTTQIVCDDINNLNCGLECKYLDDFFESCKLFNMSLTDHFDGKYDRCKLCLDSEVKNAKS